MAVPGHDTRDYEFALKFNLPVKRVVAPVETSQSANAVSSSSSSSSNGAQAATSAAEAGPEASAGSSSSSSSKQDSLPYCEHGVAVASSSSNSSLDINGLPTSLAKEKVGNPGDIHSCFE
jgi:hypothetical protein